MDSGLASGDAYPIKPTTPTSATATIEDTTDVARSATTSLRVNGITATTGVAVSVIFSTGEDGATAQSYAMDATIIGFFFSGTDTRVRQEYYHEAATTLTMDGALVGFAATIGTPVGTSTTNQTGATVSMQVQTTANANGDFVQFVLPWGTTFGSTQFTFASNADSFNSLDSLGSSIRFYKFPTVWGTTLDTSNNALTTPAAIQISAVNTRISDFSAASDVAGKTGWAVTRNVGNAITDACTHSATVDWNAMGMASAILEFSSCTISMTDTNTQSAATKAFT
jgi:hypothetical protein